MRHPFRAAIELQFHENHFGGRHAVALNQLAESAASVRRIDLQDVAAPKEIEEARINLSDIGKLGVLGDSRARRSAPSPKPAYSVFPVSRCAHAPELSVCSSGSP